MVVMSMTGGGWSVGAQHNHNLEAWFVHSPGLKVVMPSTAEDFCGLLKAAIRDENPVMFFTDMTLGYAQGDVPQAETVVPLGKACVRTAGRDVTIVSYSKAVDTCMVAAQQLKMSGISAEVIDLRTLKPLDEERYSLQFARRVVWSSCPSCRICFVGADIAAMAVEKAFRFLRARGAGTGPDAPPRRARVLEQAYMPRPEGIAADGGRW